MLKLLRCALQARVSLLIHSALEDTHCKQEWTAQLPAVRGVENACPGPARATDEWPVLHMQAL